MATSLLSRWLFIKVLVIDVKTDESLFDNRRTTFFSCSSKNPGENVMMHSQQECICPPCAGAIPPGEFPKKTPGDYAMPFSTDQLPRASECSCKREKGRMQFFVGVFPHQNLRFRYLPCVPLTGKRHSFSSRFFHRCGTEYLANREAIAGEGKRAFR